MTATRYIPAPGTQVREAAEVDPKVLFIDLNSQHECYS